MSSGNQQSTTVVDGRVVTLNVNSARTTPVKVQRHSHANVQYLQLQNGQTIPVQLPAGLPSSQPIILQTSPSPAMQPIIIHQSPQTVAQQLPKQAVTVARQQPVNVVRQQQSTEIQPQPQQVTIVRQQPEVQQSQPISYLQLPDGQVLQIQGTLDASSITALMQALNQNQQQQRTPATQLVQLPTSSGTSGGVQLVGNGLQLMGTGGGVQLVGGGGVGQNQQLMQMPGGQIVLVNQPATSNVSQTNQITASTSQHSSMNDPQLLEEEPLYVNARQYQRILKRRQARARLEQRGRIPKVRQKYLHESRHKHAMARVRNQGGRFASKSNQHTDDNAVVVSMSGSNNSGDDVITYQMLTNTTPGDAGDINETSTLNVLSPEEQERLVQTNVYFSVPSIPPSQISPSTVFTTKLETRSPPSPPSLNSGTGHTSPQPHSSTLLDS